MKRGLTFFFFISLLVTSAAQESPEKVETNYHKGKLYFYWGYNRAYFSKTNLHFTGPNYDFILYNLTAHDRPSKFGLEYLNPLTFSIPQYNFRLGYFLTEHLSVSGGWDHMKYVIDQGQTALMSGIVTPAASLTYQGSYFHQPVQITSDLLIFEHTNGFNLVSLDFEYLIRVATLSKKFSFHFNLGIGGIWIVPKTDVRVFGDGLDNEFHLAGYTLAVKTGPRLEYKKNFFIAAEAKYGYASLPYVNIKNSSPEVSDHNVTYLEWYVIGGMYFNLKFKKKKTDKSQT